MKIKSFISVLTLFAIVIAKSQTIQELTEKLAKSKTLKESSKIESDIGRMYFGEGDFVTAQKYFFASLKKAEKLRNNPLIASACNNIAATYMETENYSIAEQYAKKSILINTKLNDHKGLADSYNSLANVYYMLEKDDLSMYYFSKSLEQREIVKDSAGLFAGYKNLGANLYEIGKTDEAIKNIEKSLRYISKKTDTSKWIGSYLTLSQANLYSGKLTEAKSYLDLCYQYIKNYKDRSKAEDYYFTLSQYYEKKGDTNEAFENFKLYAKFRDSVVNTKKNVQLSELNVKYETEKKQNLINQQEFEIKQKNNWLIFGGILSFILLVVLFFIYKNYQHKQDKKLQKEIFRQQELETKALFEGEQNERIRIARDLHDSVGQMLSLIKMNLSSQEQNQETENIQSLVDKTISEVRNISHNLIPEELNFGIFPALENLADKVNASSTTKMELHIPEEIKEIKFQKQNELSIYRIVQEVVNNMIKHADASSINLSIKKLEKSLIINIKDNGKGMNQDEISKSRGIGWKNINARVHMMDGKIKINSEKLAGTQIEITLPQNG
ncbi:tetratricopeptide repeat protein [Epilithonimonas sp. UC225_85]|uniref:tetratricopeptide repeat-containing sensor histidine kinase n=1 Tax=Epilithonimonas sp. UC225_85 TaxID=3350167 RepID=UPI0036D276F3